MSNSWNKNNYRQQQEAFISGHSGTTSREVIYAIMPNICSILLTTTIIGLFNEVIHRNIRVLIEFALIVIPSILCCTILSEYVITVCFIMMAISAINILILGFNLNSLPIHHRKFPCDKKTFHYKFQSIN